MEIKKEKLIVTITPNEKERIILASQIQKRSMNSIARIGAVQEAERIIQENKLGDTNGRPTE